jgi:phage/plasmid-like protein (TIGR03299 family)
MPHEFVMGFFSNNEPAWHGLGRVLPDGAWPGRAEAMRLAGHDWRVVEHDVSSNIGGVSTPLAGWKGLFRSDTGEVLSVVKKTYGVIQNEVPYDLLEAVASEGVKWHCGMTLLNGKCVVVGYLPAEWTAPGDNSPTLPFLTALWSHDGTTALQIVRTAIRVVCANTRAMAISEAAKTGLQLTIRHTSGWREYVERARDILRRTHAEFAEYQALATELTKLALDEGKVEAFLNSFLPMPDLTQVQYSERVKNNVERARDSVRAILAGPTIADAHRRTGYGVWQAGLEYLQHRRPTRRPHSKLNRSILSEERVATNLHRLVMEVAK